MAYRRYYRRYRKAPSIGFIPALIIILGILLPILFSHPTDFDQLLSRILYSTVGLTLFAGAFVVGWMAWQKYRIHKRYRAMQISQIDTMDPFEFEHYLKHLLAFRGFTNIQVTQAEGDFGADLTATKASASYAIQAKRFATHNKVGIEAIYQVLGGQQYYQCQKTMVITTGYFTDQAKKLAQKSSTILIDRNRLAKVIEEFIAKKAKKNSRKSEDLMI